MAIARRRSLAPAIAGLLLTCLSPCIVRSEVAMPPLRLIPYPKSVRRPGGSIQAGPARFVESPATPTGRVARASLRSYLPGSGDPVPVRLGSVEEGYRASWLQVSDRKWLASRSTSPEASIVHIDATGITVVGKGKRGMLYGVQTVNQLLLDHEGRPAGSLPMLHIRDWPDMRWRCLSPQMTWYSGYNRLEGYDNGNWTLDEWKWLADWSLLHKCNAWALCMYGNWPFTLPGYPETTLDVASFRWNPRTGRKEAYRFIHRNIRKEFLPALIRYANERGIQVHAYIGKNSFNGTYGQKHPDANAGGAAELIPFHPGVHEYWDAMIGRLLQIGFNGFVFEDPEAMHVPKANADCYRTFWQPWEKTYGFHSAAEVDENKPPLGVHVEYYTWLFRTFDGMIRRHARALGRPDPEIYLISHILLSRMVGESKSQAERDRWFALIDEKQGRKVPFVILEADEGRYVSFLGHDRVASLGGRGGSCTNAMRRIASINNNWCGGGMGGDLAYERRCQEHIFKAGGFGAMGYIFEWTNTEVFGYLAAQYLWRNAGVPGINNEDQVGFLDVAYRLHYGDGVGGLVARVMDEGSCVNDAMMLEGVYGSQYPETGRPLHRDYQYLAVLADRTVALARRAYRLYTGSEPSITSPGYRPEAFRWSGQDQAADHLFKAERLRLLYVGALRSQAMCRAVLAQRLALRLHANGEPKVRVVDAYRTALAEAGRSFTLYATNYDDDYDWTDGLCSRVRDEIAAQLDRIQRGEAPGARDQVLQIDWQPVQDEVPTSPKAATPGRYLSVNLGIDQRDDYYKLGVAFSVEAQSADGKWRRLFRRSLGRRSAAWESWDIPIPAGATRLRLITDSYTRAQDPTAPSRRWALWGDPQVVEVSATYSRRVVRNLAADETATRLVRLDRDGRDRPFDTGESDSTGAVFHTARQSKLDLLVDAGHKVEWVNGFAGWVADPPHRGGYRSYLGDITSGWAYREGEGSMTWRTSPTRTRRPLAIAWVGGTGYARGKGELWLGNRKLVAFDMAQPRDMVWQAGNVVLRYLHGGDTRSPAITYGISGVYVLELPAGVIQRGQAAELTVRLTAGAGDWFMVHESGDPFAASRDVAPPGQPMPCILAGTPGKGGEAGVTIAEYEVKP